MDDTYTIPTVMRRNVQALPVEDIERELTFAQAAVDANDPGSVYWLAALYMRYDAEVVAHES